MLRETREMPTSSLKQQQLVTIAETVNLIPGLPNDVASLILAFVPYSHHSRLKPTCKSWFIFFSSKTLIFDRLRKFNSLSHLLCIFPQDPSLSSPFLFDAANRAWLPLPPLPCNPSTYSLCNFTSISLGPHIYLLGGSHFDARSFPLDRPLSSDSAFRFNFVTFSWERIAPMISPRGSFACAAVRSLNQIIVAGGGSRHSLFAAAGNRISSVEMYDVARNEWVPMDGLPRFRAGCVGFVAEESGEFWVMGGYGGSRTVSGVLPVDEYYRDAVVLQLKKKNDDDSDMGTWKEVGDMWEEGERSRIGKIVVMEDENQGVPEVFMLDKFDIFRYVSGYKNRFQNFIKYLREMGDEVMVVTTHEGVPREFYGAKLIGSRSFPCPWYQKVPLSLALSPRIISEVARFKPDIIHASSPGIMVFGALIIAKILCVPIVMSYHTHVPVYIPRYTFSWLVKPMWLVIKFLHTAADLTLVPSVAIGKDLEAARVTAANKIRLWNKGVDSESFHPRFRSNEMRWRLSDGEPEKPLIVHVGRLGVEKSLDFLKRVMDRLPEARIAFIGDGPYREELEKMFTGMPAVFTGMLQGEELSQAYASGDVFVMPSESETLGFVVLEAMSSGIPVVGVRAGGIPDIIPEDQEGKTGYMYNPGDLDDCLSKLEPLLYNKELRETMGQAARKEMEKYDWKAATRKIRNEQYNAAIWFWRKKRAQLLRPIQWLAKRIFPSAEVNYS